MNSVSWFIYIAQVANSIGVLFCVLGGGTIIAGGLYVLFNAIENEKFVVPKGVAAIAVGFLVVGNLMPQKDTMYAIAASQVGEQITKTEIASDATKALHLWIKKQIERTETK